MSKLKSFEQFVSEKNRAEEIEQKVVDKGTPDTKGHEEVDDEAEEVQAGDQDQEVEELKEDAGKPAEELKDETIDVSTEKEFDGKNINETPDDDSAELKDELKGQGDATGKEISESEEVKESKTVAEMLTEIYESSCKNEAKAYEEDAHDEHTVEAYMKENATLVGGLAVKTLKEMKDDYTTEAYEAACNEMIEAYSKKVNEMKEMDHSADAEDMRD